MSLLNLTAFVYVRPDGCGNREEGIDVTMVAVPLDRPAMSRAEVWGG